MNKNVQMSRLTTNNTVHNLISIINHLMKSNDGSVDQRRQQVRVNQWLHKRGETYIRVQHLT